jgi:ADP-ribose pyrophosphatase YjhB (NUDIX family)
MEIKPPANHVKDSHCSYCGTKFTEQRDWPRKCFICWNESYRNPIPIVVSMVSVLVDNRMGLLIQQRGIEPAKGGWAFPSGYINHGESWEEAAVRENEEEMNFFSKPEDYDLYSIVKPPSGNMLIFCRYRKVWEDKVTEFVERFLPNEEVMSLGIYYGDTELAFPSHNECGLEVIKILQNTLSPWNY